MAGVLNSVWNGVRGWFGPEREGRNLARDSRWIVNDMELSYRSEVRERIASVTRETLVECGAAIEAQPEQRPRLVADLQRRHREARRRQDIPLWTALTLAIIYLKAQAIGDHGDEARGEIDEFLAQWQHTAES